jgi:glycosidase
LDDIPDAELDRLGELGFDWLWFLSVWQTGPAAQAISRANPEWRKDFEQTLPDLREEDIAGSGFAIQNYTVHHDLGGPAALARLRERMQGRGLKLMLDFVPNHMAPDHPWIDEHPDYFVHGSETDLARSPQNYCRMQTRNGPLVLAYGRDPYFDGWPDTLQLNYGNPQLQQAMIGALESIAGQCDGVRCDMAMLVLPEVFERTWGIRAELFWPKATESARRRNPDFQFMAEVYWDMEWTIQQQGFDYAYDKRLYDRLREAHARPVREHFYAGIRYQTSWRAFWKITTNRARPLPSYRKFMKPRQSLHSCRRDCAFFTRDNSRRERNGSHLIWSGHPRSRSIRNSTSFTTGCFRRCAILLCGTATGNCSSARRPGNGTGPGIALSRTFGKERMMNGCSLW